MTQSDERAAERLRHMIDEVHSDARAHLDPCGEDLLRLIQAIDKHAWEEEDSIDAYAQLAEQSSDPRVKAVMRMLVEDERRHHRQFLSIANSLRDRLYWTPASGGPTIPCHDGWAARVRAFEAEERRGSEDLRDLARSARSAGDVLGGVLLEAMAMDSQKHARLLAFVQERLGGGQRD